MGGVASYQPLSRSDVKRMKDTSAMSRVELLELKDLLKDVALKNGSISRKQWRSCCADAGLTDSTFIDDFFGLFDVGDGTALFSEFAIYAALIGQPVRAKKIQYLYKVFDRDDDGALDLDEFLAAATAVAAVVVRCNRALPGCVSKNKGKSSGRLWKDSELEKIEDFAEELHSELDVSSKGKVSLRVFTQNNRNTEAGSVLDYLDQVTASMNEEVDHTLKVRRGSTSSSSDDSSSSSSNSSTSRARAPPAKGKKGRGQMRSDSSSSSSSTGGSDSSDLSFSSSSSGGGGGGRGGGGRGGGGKKSQRGASASSQPAKRNAGARSSSTVELSDTLTESTSSSSSSSSSYSDTSSSSRGKKGSKAGGGSSGRSVAETRKSLAASNKSSNDNNGNNNGNSKDSSKDGGKGSKRKDSVNDLVDELTELRRVLQANSRALSSMSSATETTDADNAFNSAYGGSSAYGSYTHPNRYKSGPVQSSTAAKKKKKKKGGPPPRATLPHLSAVPEESTTSSRRKTRRSRSGR